MFPIFEVKLVSMPASSLAIQLPNLYKYIYLFHHEKQIKVNLKIAPRSIFGESEVWENWNAPNLVLKSVIKLLLAIVLKFGLKKTTTNVDDEKSFMLDVQLPNQVTEEELHPAASSNSDRYHINKNFMEPNSTTSNQFRFGIVAIGATADGKPKRFRIASFDRGYTRCHSRSRSS